VSATGSPTEIDVPRVKPGMNAKVTLAARPGKPVDARVERVAVASRTSEQKLIVYPVALKLLSAPSEELRHRLLREAKACGRLDHRNIVSIYDTGRTAEGEPDRKCVV
jgi:serine/threonine protein kinase